MALSPIDYSFETGIVLGKLSTFEEKKGNRDQENLQGNEAELARQYGMCLASPSESFVENNRFLTEVPKKKYFGKGKSQQLQEFIVKRIDSLEIKKTEAFSTSICTLEAGAAKSHLRGLSTSLPTQINHSNDQRETEPHGNMELAEEEPKTKPKELNNLESFGDAKETVHEGGSGITSRRTKRRLSVKGESDPGSKTGREIRPTDANIFCLVCFENQPDCVIMQCGHGGICYDCTLDVWRKSGECFLCRNVLSLNFGPVFEWEIIGKQKIEKVYQIDLESRNQECLKVLAVIERNKPR